MISKLIVYVAARYMRAAFVLPQEIVLQRAEGKV